MTHRLLALVALLGCLGSAATHEAPGVVARPAGTSGEANSLTLVRAQAGTACPNDAQSPAQATPVSVTLPANVAYLGSGFACGALAKPRLVLKSIRLTPGAGTLPRTSLGTLLYVVESGTVTFIHNKEAPTLNAGDTLVIQKGDLYGYNNPFALGADTSLLRLSLAPPDQEDGPIAQNVTPVVTYTVIGDPIVATLFSADLPRSLGEVNGLFVARMSWPDSPEASGWIRHPGAVGLKVEQGPIKAIVGDTERSLDAGGCFLIPSQVPYQVVPSQAPASVLIVGSLPLDEPAWQIVDAAAAANVQGGGPLGATCR